ncbi:MAG: hypothetical protein SGPRY_003257 [Prymnesium sp.]
MPPVPPLRLQNAPPSQFHHPTLILQFEDAAYSLWQYFKDNWVIHPQSWWLPHWMMVVVSLLLYNVIFIPLRVCFTINYRGTALEYIDIVVDCFFWIDIVLHFRLGCGMRYLRTWFALDFISVFPFDVVIEAVLSATDPTYADSSSHSTARLTRLVRLTRLPRLLRLFKFLRARRFLTSWSHPGLLAPSVWRLMMLMMWVVILVHVVACVLHFIHETEADDGVETWLTSLEERAFVGPSTADHYVAALYWSVMTMTTVGYGDVHVSTTAERLYAMVCMMLGAFLFAYLLGHTQHLLSHLEDASSEIQLQKDQINSWMRYRNLSPDLQFRVRSYFSFFWSRRNVFDEAANLEMLPIHLRKEVAMATNSKIISNIPFFGIADDQTFIAEIVLRMSPVAAAGGDWIITAGEIGAEMFIVDRRWASIHMSRTRKEDRINHYFAARVPPGSGCIEIVAPSGDTVYRRLYAGDFFGEIALLTKARRTASCRAATFCELWVLMRKDLQEVFADYPEMHQQLTLYANGELDSAMHYVRDDIGSKSGDESKSKKKAKRIYNV